MIVAILFCPSGVAAAAGTQTAAERPAHQTCPEDHEVPAAPQGEMQSTAVLLITLLLTHTHTHTHAQTQVFIVQLSVTQRGQRVVNIQAHTQMPLYIETLTTYWTYFPVRLYSSQRGRGKLHNETSFLLHNLRIIRKSL